MNQIASIEEVKVHGTAELRTERLVLRRYRPEDAAALDDLAVGEKRYERLFFEYKFEFITET